MTNSISKHQMLQKLMINLSACYQITEESLINLFGMIATLQSLSCLKLYLYSFYQSKIFTDPTIFTLASSLTKLPLLKDLTLGFGRTSVRDDTFSNLANMIPNLKGLKSLDFTFENAVNCSENSFYNLTNNLTSLSNLTQLNLKFQCCELSDIVLYNLSECLARSLALNTVSIHFPYHGRFTTLGMSRFRQRIHTLKHIKHLLISENPRAPVKMHQNQDLLLIIIVLTMTILGLRYLFF